MRKTKPPLRVGGKGGLHTTKSYLLAVTHLRQERLTEITNGDFLASFKNFLQLFFLPVDLLAFSAFVFDRLAH